MKKRTLTVVALLALLLLPLAGSLAFFTAEETAHNVITTGEVDIRLIELSKEGEDSRPVPFEDVSNVMPGQSVSKIVMAENTGSGDAWLRIILRPGIKLSDGSEADGQAFAQLISLDIDSENWIADTVEPYCYYYKLPLKSGETSTPLMSGLSFSTEMDNKYQNAEFTLDVSAQAVQVKNNGSSPTEALGWPAADKP